MHKLFSLLATLLCLLMIGVPVYAQEATAEPDTNWQVIEQCVGEPTQPPEGWSYDGTILMTGYAGIHGVNAAWDTPHVLTQLSDSDVWGGAVSPDGKWYVSPYGQVEITSSNNVITTTNEIRIYSLTDNNASYQIPWESPLVYGGTHVQTYWRDNENFIYANIEGTLMVNPFMGETNEWVEPGMVYDAYAEYRSKFSPDGTRVIYTQQDEMTRELVKHLYVLPSNKLITTLPVVYPIAWMPNSTGFIASVTDEKLQPPSSELVLFDRDGKFLQNIINSQGSKQFGAFTVGWSADSRYFGFITFDYSKHETYSTENRLYIADMKSQKIIDTCKAIGVGMAWHPDNHQVAFFSPGVGLKNVLIFDLDSFSLYAVANHIVGYNIQNQFGFTVEDSILGWRGD